MFNLKTKVMHTEFLYSLFSFLLQFHFHFSHRFSSQQVFTFQLVFSGALLRNPRVRPSNHQILLANKLNVCMCVLASRIEFQWMQLISLFLLPNVFQFAFVVVALVMRLWNLCCAPQTFPSLISLKSVNSSGENRLCDDSWNSKSDEE